MMRAMRRTVWIAALGLVGAGAVASFWAGSAAAEGQREERVLEIARRMAAALSGAESLRLTGQRRQVAHGPVRSCTDCDDEGQGPGHAATRASACATCR